MMKSSIFFWLASILNSAALLNDELRINLSAFEGHFNNTVIISPWKPESVQLNSIINNEMITFSTYDGIFKINIRFKHSSTSKEEITIKFKR